MRTKRKGMIIMGSLILIKGQIPAMTPEQKERLAKLESIRDEDIDYSDIPPLTDKERGNFKRLRDKKDLWKKMKIRLVED